MSRKIENSGRCGQCEVPLPEGAKFCHNCGQPVGGTTSVEIPAVTNRLDSQTLHRLGPRQYLERVAEHGQHLTSERRFVTTLFSDVVGSTSLAEKLDPEEVTALMNEAFAEMIEPVHRYEGTLARLMGDGILCLFGAPVSHEDDAIRACNAAIEIIQAIKVLSDKVCDKYGISSFQVRIGISTGLAVVGEVGTSVRSEYTAMGDAVNLAARLQHAAPPGEILICGETWKLVKRQFSYKNSDTIQVRGRSQAVDVYSLEAGNIRRDESRDNGQLPGMVGRRDELARFHKAFDDLNSGKGSIVSVIGAAGMGKTRLLYEARKSMPSDFSWIEATCMAYMQTASYWVIREFIGQLIKINNNGNGFDLMPILREMAGQNEATCLSDKNEFSDIAIQHSSVSLPAVIGHLLQQDLNETETAFIKSLSAESLNQKIISEIIALVRQYARSNKLILVIEDIHWVDPESLLMLKMLARKLDSINVILLLACRPGNRTTVDDISKAVNNGSIETITMELTRLSRDECEEFAREFVGDKNLSNDLLERIVEITEGNAFFLQEMLRAIPESLSNNQGALAIKHNISSDVPAIPQTVQATILARVDKLPARTRSVLQTAAVLGRTFQLKLLIKLLGTNITTTQIDEALNVLIGRNLISHDICRNSPRLARKSNEHFKRFENDKERIDFCKHYSECEFYFTHALFQEVVYGTLLYSKRRELHASAGYALETIVSNNGNSAENLLAFHFDRGEQRDRAIEYYARSARQAVDMFSLESATFSYSRALDLMRESNGSGNSTLLAKLYEGIGDVHFLKSEYKDAIDNFNRSLELTGDKKRLTELNFKKGKVFQKWGKFDEAKQALEAAMDNLKQNFDEKLAGQIYGELSLAYYHLKDLDIAEELGLLALTLAENTEDASGLGQASNNLGVILTKKGDWDGANNYFSECKRIGVEISDFYGLAACYNNWGLLAVEQKSWNDAEERFKKSLEMFEFIENKHGLARVYDNLSAVFYNRGEDQKAEEYLFKAIAILAEIGVIDKKPLPEMWQSGTW